MKNEDSKTEEIIEQFSQKSVLVIGDIMLDNYIFGDINRISPEAPVPVLTQTTEKRTLGGAANVAENLCKLANKVYLAGVIGNDENGTSLKNLLVREGIDRSAVILDSERHTTIKTRLIAQDQQIARIDKEKKQKISNTIENKIIQATKEIIDNVQAIVLSDYAKGVLTPSLCKEIIHLANEKNIPIIVDPKDDFTKFMNATVIKPNMKEIINVTKIENEEEAVKAVFNQTNARHIILTKGKHGMSVYSRNPQNDSIEKKDLKAISDEVYDITGAGDTVTALLALSLSITSDIFIAAKIANNGAGVVVHKIGTATASKQELLDVSANKNSKIKSKEDLIKIVEDLKKQGKTIVSTNGSFDLLHAGHVYFLEEAKKQGDILVVGLNSDSSVRTWKKQIKYKDWKKRPVIPQESRAAMLAGLECVDYIMIFDDSDCLAFVESIKPNIHANGSEYGENCIEAPVVKKHGGRIHIIDKIPGMSTSELINKIKDAYTD